ncbi:MAG TPA: DUF6194 family protein [Thermomicrobiales bacterium]|nr:DUF6194 family protein [Thermomicrobiales bacterium]
MDQRAIIDYIADTFDGVDVVTPTEGIAAGDTFFIYDPDRDLEPKHQFPFATIVTKDYGDFDRASHLDRPGVFRLNIGVSAKTYSALFGPHPSQPAGAGAAESGRDFTALDQLLPHPVYATQSWVCVLNPSAETFETVRPLLAEAYDLAVNRHTARRRTGNRDTPSAQE